MIVKKLENIDYIVFDPSKNITALIISKVDPSSYIDISKKIMDKESQVEQVGFLTYDGGLDILLRMAGGEFCGNATMCAAVYCAMKNDLSKASVRVKVLGVDEIINVEVKKTNDNEWEGIVKMPKALEIKNVTFPDGKILPVVFYSRIAHIIIQDDVGIKSIHDKERAELTIKKYCDFLKVPALGMMYFNSKDANLVPLVYVKSVDTLFWENSCASGTTAVGAWIFSNNNENNIGKTLKINVNQPSKAVLTIYNDDNGSIYLKGNVRIDA